MTHSSIRKVENSLPEGIENPDVYFAAISALEGSSEDEPKNSSELVKAVGKTLHGELKGYRIYRYILQAAQLPTSRIKSRQGRGGGYFLVDASLTETVETFSQAEEEKDTLEKHLWPIVVDWLKTHKQVEFASSTIANIKAGGKWGNPDVVGFNVIEELGFYDVEITTLEVKPSITDWKQFLFEAVSHKRFSERVYFAFRTEGELQAKDRIEMQRYAEKYGIGLVNLQVDNDSYKSLTNWDKKNEEFKVGILENFVELAPAPFEAISIRNKIDFLKQLGISKKSDIYNFN